MNTKTKSIQDCLVHAEQIMQEYKRLCPSEDGAGEGIYIQNILRDLVHYSVQHKIDISICLSMALNTYLDDLIQQTENPEALAKALAA